jgi:hypothetical protein
LEISDSSALVCLQKVFVFLVRESSGICKAKLRHTVPQFSCTQLTSSLSLSLSLYLSISPSFSHTIDFPFKMWAHKCNFD